MSDANNPAPRQEGTLEEVVQDIYNALPAALSKAVQKHPDFVPRFFPRNIKTRAQRKRYVAGLRRIADTSNDGMSAMFEEVAEMYEALLDRRYPAFVSEAADVIALLLRSFAVATQKDGHGKRRVQE